MHIRFSGILSERRWNIRKRRCVNRNSEAGRASCSWSGEQFQTSYYLNPVKPEITKYKHQITNKFQITKSKFQIRSKTNSLVRLSRIGHCNLFVIFNFLLLKPGYRHLTPYVPYNMLSEKPR
jgi:hypothetical protein